MMDAAQIAGTATTATVPRLTTEAGRVIDSIHERRNYGSVSETKATQAT